MKLPDRLLLPFTFDPALLMRDLQSLSRVEWIQHFIKQNYDGEWSVIPLRAKAGARHPVMMIYSDPSTRCYEDTPLLEGCAYFREVLATFNCPLLAVRLMQLTPGSLIKEHSDHDLSFEDGTVRIHVPVTTNDDVEFILNGQRVIMEPGSSWYVRLSEPHSVANRGQTSRVHMVIDAVVNDWVEAVFTEAARSAKAEPVRIAAQHELPASQFDQFYAMVLEDVSLHDKLRQPDDAEAFVALVLDTAKAHGFSFTAEDVRAAIQDTSRVFAGPWVLA